MATSKKRTINIYRDGVWAGSGTLASGGRIEDCAAELGPDADASEETYELIEDAIDGDWSPAEVVQPDGTYTWTIESDDPSRRTVAADRFLAAVEQSWDTRDPLEQTAAHGLSETDADALAAICDETGDDLETATAEVLAAVRAKLAATA